MRTCASGRMCVCVCESVCMQRHMLNGFKLHKNVYYYIKTQYWLVHTYDIAETNAQARITMEA